MNKSKPINWDSIPDGSIHCDDIRNYCRIANRHVITPPEIKIDIFSTTELKYPVWKPKVTLDSYSSLSKVFLDIETTRLRDDIDDIRYQAKHGRIMMIGIRNERKQNRIIRNSSEAQMLRDLFALLERKRPDVLLTFNGMAFDLPYIHERANILGVKSPFYINYENLESRFGAAAIAGRPWDEYFRPVHATFGGKKTNHIDVYQQAIAYDSVLRKFTKYSLKSLPIQLGLRDEERLDLGIEGIEECYRIGDWATLQAYLEYDLEDTELLSDFFMPGLYYQQVYFPGFTLQQLATTGNATKWNRVLENHYGKQYTLELPKPKVHQFQGAITLSVAGVHQDVAGCDFSGQYPSCMLQYGICSKNDPDGFMLGVMAQAVEYRNTIKYKEDLTQFDKDLATAVKPLVNCLAPSTLVTTDKGIYPIVDLVDKKVNVLNGKAEWSSVEFKHYGFDRLYKVTLGRKKEKEVIYTTGNHKWLYQSFNRYYVSDARKSVSGVASKKFTQFKKTTELKCGKNGDLIPYISAPKPSDTNQDYFNGVIHGIVYGDGSLKKTSGKAINYNPEKGQAYITDLIGNKKELFSYFEKANNILLTAFWVYHDDNYSEPDILSVRCYSHIKLKELPSLETSNSYLLGFFRGLMTTDGTVSSSKGGVPCFTMQKHVCEYLLKIASRIGFKGFTPYKTHTQDTIHEFKNGHQAKLNYDYYRINFQLSDFEDSDFLRSFHSNNFRKKNELSEDSIRVMAPWRVESVEETNIISDVYCCEEPVTHTFVLNNGVLTGNSAYGSLAADIPYGDSISAAIVTLFARARLLWAKSFVESMCGEVVLSDTDSVWLKTAREDIHERYPVSAETLKKLPPNPSKRLLSAVAIIEQLKENIPSGSKLDLEAVNKILFVPPSNVPSDFDRTYKFNSKLGKNYFQKVLSTDKKIYQYALDNFGGERVGFYRLKQIAERFDIQFPNYESVKKSYIKIEWNQKKQTWSLSAKGRFVKRDAIPFEKAFQKEYLELYADNPESAKMHYFQTLTRLVAGTYDKERLTITRKIRIGEVGLVNLGFGQARDSVSFYRGKNGLPVTEGDYDVNFYVKKLNTLHQEITCFLEEMKVLPITEEVEQLSLF